MPEDALPPSRLPDQRWRGAAAPMARIDAGAARRKKALWFGGILLALVGGTIAIFSVMRRPAAPFVLSLPVREYSVALYPGNPFAEQDSRAILDGFPQSAGERRNIAFPSQRRDQLQRELEDFAGKHAEEPIVVHLTCLAVAYKGEAHLLTGDSRPGQPSTWYPLADVLKLLASSPAPGKLLLLDVTHSLADSRLGVLGEHVAESVEQTVKNHAPREKLLVLTSCAAGQTSHACEDLRQTVFAHYVNLGLRGAADGWDPRGHKDGQVTAEGLARFVAASADHFVQTYRGQRQTPWFWGDGDFILVSSRTAPAPAEAVAGNAAYPSWLLDAWKSRDDFALSGQVVPQALLLFDSELERLERRWRDGEATDKLQRKAADLKLDLATKWQLPPWEAGAGSVAQALVLASPELREPGPVDAVVEGLREAQKAAAKDKMEEWIKAKLALQKTLKDLATRAPEKSADPKEPPKVGEPRDKAIAYLLAAETSLQALAKIESDPRQVALIHEQLLELKKEWAPAGGHAETVWLQRALVFNNRLVRKQDPDYWKWPGAAVRQALRTVRAREKALAMAIDEPAALPWFEAAFRKAETTRRQAEKALFAGEPGDWEQIDSTLRQAEREYHLVQDRIKELQGCRRALQEAWAFLPGYVPYLNALPQPGREEELWSQAVGETRRLAEKAGGPAASGAVDASELAFRLKELSDRVETRARELIGRKIETDLPEVGALLASPRLRAELRGQLWQTRSALSQSLLKQIQKVDENEGHAPTAAPAPPAFDRAAQMTQALRRARLALEVLNLSEAPGLDAARRELDAAALKTRPQDLEALATAVLDAWQRLPLQYREARSAPVRADPLSRMAPLIDTGFSNDPASLPALVLHQDKQRALMTWLADQHRQESRHVLEADGKEGGPASRFFLDAALQLQRR